MWKILSQENWDNCICRIWGLPSLRSSKNARRAKVKIHVSTFTTQKVATAKLIRGKLQKEFGKGAIVIIKAKGSNQDEGKYWKLRVSHKPLDARHVQSQCSRLGRQRAYRTIRWGCWPAIRENWWCCWENWGCKN